MTNELSVPEPGDGPFGADYKGYSEDVFFPLHLTGRGISVIAVKHSFS